MNKFNAIKTEYRGITYDSKWEATRAYELDMLERAGRIKDLQRQVRFILQEGYINNKGQKIRPISYIADFTYITSKGQKVVEDTKSPATRTQVYALKKKMFEYKFPEYEFIESVNKKRPQK